MIPLNLPNSALKITLRDQKKFIWDRLRKKFVALTPEEWVRQNFIEFLINHKGYPETLMNNEIAVRLNGMNKRCDSVIFNKSGKPVVIIEYKAPQVLINQNVFDQIVRYNMVLQVPFLIVSNGLSHYCCEVDYLNHRCNFLQDIPLFGDIAERVEK